MRIVFRKLVQIQYLLLIVTLQAVNHCRLVKGIVTYCRHQIDSSTIILLCQVILTSVEHAVTSTQGGIGHNSIVQTGLT